jgi:hypothetical protein
MSTLPTNTGRSLQQHEAMIERVLIGFPATRSLRCGAGDRVVAARPGVHHHEQR